ncbi:hypothetical protein ABMA27_002365 [Loxostege sticticalis]|uniref:t-SNARE coiled-coil homology domain-containing protein n=1 Tax=Loxostege sticticalis TaxID=481309 RepID=A0ABR3HXQ9_LOXSC
MRSKDRLAELQQLANGGIYQDTVVELALPALDSEYQKDIDEMFLEVERMRTWVHELNSNTQLMRRLHADPTFHTNKHLQDQMDSVITQSNGVGLKVCGALRQFEARVAAGAAQRNDARARMARLQYAATRRLYADALAAHHRALQALRDHQLHLLHEQIKLTNLTISDEECQSLLDSNNISLFVDNVKAETAEAKRALRDVEARHEELARVEASLQELRDLFVQLAHLVATQQDQIDSVEYYALQATGHVELGGRELLKGTVSHAKAKKKKLGLVICMASGIAIVLLVLIIT